MRLRLRTLGLRAAIMGIMASWGGRLVDAADCNNNGTDDAVDIAEGTSADCDANGVPDECDVADGASLDCDANGVPDECQLEAEDCDENGRPDACDPDCNGNGVVDACDIAPPFAFFTPGNLFIAGRPSAVAAADLDGDGDLAVSSTQSGSVSVLKNHGNGTFGPAVRVAAGVAPHSVVSGDFDGDGDVDMSDLLAFQTSFTGSR